MRRDLAKISVEPKSYKRKRANSSRFHWQSSCGFVSGQTHAKTGCHIAECIHWKSSDYWQTAIVDCLASLWSIKLSLHFNRHFSDGSVLAGTRTSPFWILLELKLTEVVVTTGAIRCAKLQIVTTNKRTPSCFTGRMPFLSPNRQCKSTEGKLEQVFDFDNTSWSIKEIVIEVLLKSHPCHAHSWVEVPSYMALTWLDSKSYLPLHCYCSWTVSKVTAEQSFNQSV